MNLENFYPPKKGEIYGYFSDQEFNNYSCSPPNGAWTPITAHLEWFYKSIATLREGDIGIFGGDFVFLDNSDNVYYKGGARQAVKDAISRGAYVVIITTRLFLCGRDGDGECSNKDTCIAPKDKGSPYACDDNTDSNYKCSSDADCSGDSLPGTECNKDLGYCYTNNCLYPKLCGTSQSQIIDLIAFVKTTKYPNNFINYDIPNSNNTPSIPYSHIKLISFYYPSRNMFSCFDGSWNVNTGYVGNALKDTGIGFVGLMSEPFGQFRMQRDENIFKVLENYYTIKGLSLTVPNYLSPYIKVDRTSPPVPIIVDTFYFCGPNFCDPNFGCHPFSGPGENIPPSARDPSSTPVCTAAETYISTVDKNVSFYFGIDPAPGQNDNITEWSTKGWDLNMYYGIDLVNKLVSEAKFYIKTSMLSQLLDTSPTYDNQWNMVKSFWNAISKAMNNGVNWIVVQPIGDGSYTTDINSIFTQIINDPVMKTKFYYKEFGWCKRPYWTHDKLWISEDSVIFSSAHPINMHYSSMIMNQDTLIQNAPSFATYMNNHFNYLWDASVENTYAPLPSDHFPRCPNKIDDKGCCIDDNMTTSPISCYTRYYSCNQSNSICDISLSATSNVDPNNCGCIYYKCDNGNCVVSDTPTNYSDKNNCGCIYYKCDNGNCVISDTKTNYSDKNNCGCSVQPIPANINWVIGSIIGVGVFLIIALIFFRIRSKSKVK